MKFCAFTLIFLLSVTFGSAALALEPEEIAKEIQQYYEQTSTLQANFEQRTTLAGMAGRARLGGGTLVVKKPGKLRWDYLQPDKQVLICDGDEVSFYVAKQQQLIISKAAQYLQEDLTYKFFVGDGNLLHDFEVKAMAAEQQGSARFGLQLTPKTSHGQVHHMLLWLDEHFQIKRLQIVDHLESLTDIRFTNLSRNKPVSDSTFLFVPPQGTEIVLQ